MTVQKTIEPSIHLKLQTEKLTRAITQCTDLDILKGIAIELLDLHQKKSAIANWATKRAVEAEGRAIKAELALENKTWR